MQSFERSHSKTDMSDKNLSFLDDGQSIASTVSQLHNYFKNAYSEQKIRRSQLVSRLEAAVGEEEQTIQTQLQQLDEALMLFGVLSDSLSTANRVLHSRTVADALGFEAEIYHVHLEDEAEQIAEREAAQRRVS